MHVLSLPNFLSFSRLLLLICFYSQDAWIRFFAVAMASITDVLDGFLARRWHLSSRFGTLLDPITDKVFAIGAAYVFLSEQSISLLQFSSFFARELSLALFFGWLVITKKWKSYQIQAFICGKITTALQFLTLACLSLEAHSPEYLFILMAIFGGASLLELFIRSNQSAS